MTAGGELRVVVMGVSGAGKSTVGRVLAERLGLEFVEGDELHPPSNVAKMAAGIPLDDLDRAPWLDLVAERLAATPCVVSCSALKRAYRDRLRQAAPDLVLVALTGSRDVLAARLAERADHFMPAKLLDSQLATLEVPGADEYAMSVDVELSVQDIVNGVSRRLATMGHFSA